MPTMTKTSDEQLLVEVEDILRAMPSRQSLGNDDPDILAWIGRASAIVHAWNSTRAIVVFDGYVKNLGASSSREYDEGYRGLITTLNQVRHDLRMKTSGPLTVAIGQGSVFDYFDEVRKVIETAHSGILFIDPYLDAEFVARYLPHVASGVAVRLLTRERISTLMPAVALMRQQSGLSIEVRSAAGFHDRYVIVDGLTCYHSGASFKDGAKKAPTTLTQVTDAFVAVSETYEQLWNTGAIHS
jgi:hypothetical protein